MPTSVIEFLGAAGAAALKPAERVLSFLNTAIFGNLILVGLNRARKKPPGPGALPQGTSTFSVRQPISPWQVVIGQRRVGGTISFIHLTADKKYLHMVVTLACHASQEIGDVWLDDEIVTSGMLDGSGVVTSGKFSRVDAVRHHEDFTLSGATYTTAATMSSVQGVSETSDNSFLPLTDVSPAAPGPGQFKWSGTTVTFDASAIGRTFAIDYTESVPEPVCRIKKSLGDETVQAFPDLIAEAEGDWVDADRQTGHTKVYIRFDTSVLQGNAPNISAVLKGLKLYDTRTGLTTWSANPALAVLAYLMNSEWGFGASLSQIGIAEFQAAANVCDESVSLAAGGSELRYTANGAFLTSENPGDVLGALLGAMGGSTAALTRASNTWRVFAGAYEAATITFTEKDFAGPVHIDTMPPRGQWANGAKGIFTDPNANWQPTDFQPIVPTSIYLAEDNGETIYVDLDFSDFVTSGSQAQRQARIEVRQARSGQLLTATYNLTAMRAATGHSVAQTFAKYGLNGKEYSIRQFALALVEGGTDEQGEQAQALGVQLVLRETNAAIFSWSAEDQPQATPSHSNLPNPFSVAAPGAPAVSEELYQTSGSAGVKSRAVVSWTALADPLVKSYEATWKLVTDSDYEIAPVPQGTSFTVDDLEAGLYLFAVRAFNGIAKSAWSPYTQKQILGLTAPPSDPTGFSVIASNGFAEARWDLSPDLDVRIGGRAIVRFSPLTTGAAWEDGILVSGSVDLPGFPGDTIKGGSMPLKTGTYLLKFIDSSGNYSTGFASFVVTEGMVTGFTTLVTITEDAAFTGSKTQVVLSGSQIQLDTSGGSIFSTGSYAFAGTSGDLVTVASRRFEATVKASSFDNGANIDSILALIDDWDSIDGAAVNDCNVVLMIRTTNDDPAGSPTWGPWTPFHVGDFSCRAAQFRLDFTSGNPNHNIAVTQLRVAIKVADVAPKASPTFTGTPAAPTAAVDTSTTQLATTAFVVGQATSATPAMDGSGAAGSSLRYARSDHVHPSDTSREAAILRFESSEQTLTAATDTAVAHGLGSRPKTVLGVIRCKTAEFGYAVNDEITMMDIGDASGAARGISPYANATNVGFVVAAGAIAVQRRDGGSVGATGLITLANWKAVLRCSIP